MRKPGEVKARISGSQSSSSSAESARSGEDRRVFPRVEMQLEARLVGENGESGKADLLNLSRGGVALRIDVENGLRVFPEGQIKPGKPVGLRFDLATSGRAPAMVQAIGRVVWSQRVPGELFVIGIEFTAFHGDSRSCVEQYLFECMRIE